MASYARRFDNNGVRLVGGCCGTTPEHVRQIKMAVRALSQPTVPVAGAVRAKTPARPAAPAVAPVAPMEKSRLANALARKQFIVSVELVPPRGHDARSLIEEARQLRIHGVDFVNIPDGPRASARMSALAASLVVQQQAGLETILHYTCRDRNLLGMQSDLLGAHSMGVRNLLIVTGDPPRVGDYPDATAVYDVDSIGLTNVVSRLNRGFDIGEQPIGHPTAFHIGVAVNPGSLDQQAELRRFEYKVEAGAEFAITQPVFDAAGFAAFLQRLGEKRIPIIAGVMPLESLRHAEFMANEVPGVHVPDGVVDRMRRAENEGRAAAEGIQIARELVAEIRPLVQGLQISAAAGALDSALQVMHGDAV
jgi:homocysteine S-methyltransferase